MSKEANDINCKRFPLGGLWTNGYLFYESGEGRDAFFVDPGGDAQEVIDYVKNNGLKLKAVLLTHGHLDHLSGIEKFVPIVGQEIYIAQEDSRLLKHPPEEAKEMLRMECGGVENFKTLANGSVLSFGSLEVKVIATPGHTPGSLCYLVSEGDKKMLVSGDTLFAQSVGRTDFPGGNWDTLVRSLKKLAELPDDLRVLPGHGPETTIGRERSHNPFWP